VDLDGTLLKVDTFWESLVLLGRHHPFSLFSLPLRLFRGKAHLKDYLAEKVAFEVTHLPQNEALLTFLREEKAQGRHLVLVTGAPRRIAQAVSDFIGLFDEVLCSDRGVNLTGHRKAALLEEKFGKGGFDYVGNAAVDLKVWPSARAAIVVNASSGLVRRAKAVSQVSHTFDDAPAKGPAFLRAIRWHQWAKNLLLFVPVMTAHALTDEPIIRKALAAFVAFCLVSSSVYLWNDLIDLRSDRRHPRKRHRPLAAGVLSIPVAVAAAPLFLAAGLLIAHTITPSFLGVLLGYVALTFAYSFYFKRVVLIDVLILAGLYTIRIIAGHEATGVMYSMWLLLFAMFFFLSLALIKRYCELDAFHKEAKSEIVGRGYVTDDRVMVATMGVASGYLSVLVLSFYVTSGDVTRLYARPALLWLLIPIMLFWISRIWLLAHRGSVHEDPVLFALKDPVSYLLGAVTAVVMAVAT
jgi:4-hydroxybenzoate polyprenyltransferase